MTTKITMLWQRIRCWWILARADQCGDVGNFEGGVYVCEEPRNHHGPHGCGPPWRDQPHYAMWSLRE